MVEDLRQWPAQACQTTDGTQHTEAACRVKFIFKQIHSVPQTIRRQLDRTSIRGKSCWAATASDLRYSSINSRNRASPKHGRSVAPQASHSSSSSSPPSPNRSTSSLLGLSAALAPTFPDTATFNRVPVSTADSSRPEEGLPRRSQIFRR